MAQAGMLDTQFIAIDRFRTFSRRGLLIAIAVHSIFVVIGYGIRSYALVADQLATIAAYAAFYMLSARGHRWSPLPLIWIDLLANPTFASYLFGIDAGFQYYTWILLPLLFSNVNRSAHSKAILAGVLTVAYVVLDAALREHDAPIVLSHSAMLAMRYFNIVSFVLVLGLVAGIHARTVREGEIRLKALASTDTLTGLLNRRRMSDRLQRELLHAREYRHTFAVLVLDVDHFKSINDRFGHQRGDEVLIAVSNVLRSSIRAGDVVARWGGEEFLVLMPNSLIADARAIAERIRASIEKGIVRDESETTPVTVTVGVATWKPGERLEETIHRADEAMYLGKQNGRNAVVEACASDRNDDSPVELVAS